MKKIDRVGMRSGKLVVIAEFEPEIKKKHKKWICKCDCGNETVVFGDNLKDARNTTSCGCMARGKGNYRHGECKVKTSEYRCWTAMNSRCNNVKDANYKNYGARGIKVCARWSKSYDAFLTDMGRRPSVAHSLDRIDVNKGYSPENCRWATIIEQANNKRTSIYYKYKDIVKSQKQWGVVLGVHYGNLLYHLKKGKTFEWVVEHFCRKNNISL